MGAIRFEFIGETSRETGKNGTATHRYLLQYEDVADFGPRSAEIYVLTHTGTVLNGVRPMIRKTLSWEEFTCCGPRWFLGFFVNVNFGVPEKDENGEEEDPLEAEEAGATPVKRLVSRKFYGEDMSIRIDTARSTERYWAPGVSSEERQRIEGYGDLIRPGKEGPEGIEITISNFVWEENWTFPRSAMTDSYVRSIPDIKNHVNNAAFRGFRKSEVKLTDFSVDDQVPAGEEEQRTAAVTIAFKFVVDPEDKVKIGNVPEFVKKGWHLVTPLFREIVSEDQKSTRLEIVAAQQQPLLTEVDFGRLRIS